LRLGGLGVTDTPDDGVVGAQEICGGESISEALAAVRLPHIPQVSSARRITYL
jgi:hypothetical protein